MTMNRNAWGSDEREEYEAMMALVVASSKNTRDRTKLIAKLLNDAVQAHRPWARDVEYQAIRTGLAKEIKAYQDRTRALVSHDGQVLNLPSIQSRRIQSVDGEIYFQRELIEVWSWEQIEAKRTEALVGQHAYTSKIAHYDALLALRDMAPGAKTPDEAVRQLGTTVDQWLGGKETAA